MQLFSLFSKGNFKGGLSGSRLASDSNSNPALPPGVFVGGCTPQAQRVQQVLALSQSWSGAQLVSVVQGLQDQVRKQTMMTPEFFGQIPFDVGVPRSTVGPLDFGRDGTHNERSQPSHVDVFSKSEKWIGSPPKPNFEAWSGRESEVIGWAEFLNDLTGWAAQARIEFSLEIEQSARWPTQILWSELSLERRARAMRLHAILKSSLQEHSRTANLTRAFHEGISAKRLNP